MNWRTLVWLLASCASASPDPSSVPADGPPPSQPAPVEEPDPSPAPAAVDLQQATRAVFDAIDGHRDDGLEPYLSPDGLAVNIRDNGQDMRLTFDNPAAVFEWLQQQHSLLCQDNEPACDHMLLQPDRFRECADRCCGMDNTGQGLALQQVCFHDEAELIRELSLTR